MYLSLDETNIYLASEEFVKAMGEPEPSESCCITTSKARKDSNSVEKAWLQKCMMNALAAMADSS